MKRALALVLLLIAPLAWAAEVAGVKFDDRMRLGSADLVLNGAGLRKRLFIQVYAIGLYVGEKKPSAAEAIALPGPKRVAIHMLRDVDAATFTEALADGMRANHDEAAMKALEPRIAALSAIMAHHPPEPAAASRAVHPGARAPRVPRSASWEPAARRATWPRAGRSRPRPPPPSGR